MMNLTIRRPAILVDWDDAWSPGSGTAGGPASVLTDAGGVGQLHDYLSSQMSVKISSRAGEGTTPFT